MARINELKLDIYDALMPENKGEVNPQALKDFYESSGTSLVRAIESPERNARPEGMFYASELQDLMVCPRKVWYKINMPEAAETLLPHVRVKFMYGDMIESLALFLAEQAGHSVSHMQGEVDYEFLSVEYDVNVKIRGRIDAVIDNHIVDVKSASPFAFKKLSEASYEPELDPFSYDLQVNFYAMHNQFEYVEKDTQVLLLVDKQSGMIGTRYVPLNEERLDAAYSNAAWVYSGSNRSAEDALLFVPDVGQKSYYADKIGDEPTTNSNRKLKTYCSYCAFKSQCWSDQGVNLRGFAYSNGPVYMTDVKKVPKNVPEFIP